MPTPMEDCTQNRRLSTSPGSSRPSIFFKERFRDGLEAGIHFLNYLAAGIIRAAEFSIF